MRTQFPVSTCMCYAYLSNIYIFGICRHFGTAASKLWSPQIIMMMPWQLMSQFNKLYFLCSTGVSTELLSHDGHQWPSFCQHKPLLNMCYSIKFYSVLICIILLRSCWNCTRQKYIINYLLRIEVLDCRKNKSVPASKMRRIAIINPRIPPTMLVL